ncbi:hypothetical protein TrLO_g8643, partial [Triparma laevis f. longispina]
MSVATLNIAPSLDPSLLKPENPANMHTGGGDSPTNPNQPSSTPPNQ